MSDVHPRDRSVAWAFVAAQVGLLVSLVGSPDGNLWPNSHATRVLASTLVIAGFVVIIVGAWGIRRGLSALPIPTASAELQTTGLYRWCRHPIYAGVLLLCAGVTIGHAHPVAVALLGTVAFFFVAKATFEERYLRLRFADYNVYAGRTPMLIPGLRPGKRPVKPGP